jgi:hypothetical protein
MRGEARVIPAVGEKGGRSQWDCFCRLGSLMLYRLLRTTLQTTSQHCIARFALESPGATRCNVADETAPARLPRVKLCFSASTRDAHGLIAVR